jgi:hypothetical protein
MNCMMSSSMKGFAVSLTRSPHPRSVKYKRARQKANSYRLESNHKARASLALATASSSVSPALAHPGKSENTADQQAESKNPATSLSP